MEGFFKESQIAKEPERRKLRGCGACKLYKGCLSPRMQATGRGHRSIMFLAEAPGADEDRRGKQLVGKAGQVLRKELRRQGFDLDDDCIKINAVNCRPPKNRTPKPTEIDACRPMVWKAIEEHKPHIIIPLGGTAVSSLIGGRWKKELDGITKWRGWNIPDRELGAWICPTYHPSFLLHDNGTTAAEVLFKDDLERALALTEKDFPKWKDEVQYVELMKKPKAIKRYLRHLFEDEVPVVALDYETTGLKPHKKGHRIVSCAISEGRKHAVAFPFLEEIEELFIDFLRYKWIRKIAANIPFEQLWSMVLLDTRVRGWAWDPMQAAHVLDNRRGITSVKFQTYVNFGVIDYASHIEPFLEGVDEKDGNSFNRIDECDEDELLTYNGLDALYEIWLARRQKKVIG